MRLLLILVAIWLVVLGCAYALAGDSATFAPVGYSADNRYFAYEEFSIGDEGHPPHATIGLLDVKTGRHYPGSAWRAFGREEGGSTLTDLRLQATDMATEALSTAAIEDPAHYLALIGDGVRDKGDVLTFALPQGADPDALGPEITLHIVDLPALIKDRCSADYGGYAVGFTLVLTSEGETRYLHTQYAEDGKQDCVRRFRLYGVLQPYNGGDVASLVAVVSVYTVGFEGYDRHFLVIPLVDPDP
jgi:predicted secreted protein